MEIQRRLSLVAMATLTLGITGCQTVVSDNEFGQYVDAPITDADIMPVSVNRQSRPKIIVLPADNGGTQLADRANLGAALSQSITQLLSGRNIEVLEAPAKLAETMRKLDGSRAAGSSYNGPKVSFIVRPVMGSAEYSAKFEPEHTYKDGKGHHLTVPAGYAHSASMTATLRVYEVPSLRQVTALNIKGASSFSDPKLNANQEKGASMLRDAAKNAVAVHNKTEILNLFASSGYVVARRTFNSKSLLQISIGREDGIKPGDKVAIYSVRKATPMLDGSIPPNEEVMVVNTTVSKVVTPTSAWVAPDDEAMALKVRRGDVARERHEDNFLIGIVKNQAN